MAYRGKDLAGTNGIPRHEDRVYVEVELREDRYNGRAIRPSRLTWPDGRSWGVSAARPVASFGRELFGNHVVKYEVTIGRATRTLWCDSSGWFVARRRTG